jgi:ribosome maturation factor RimP
MDKNNKKNNIVKIVTELAQPLVEEQGLELVDVEYVKERAWYLRVYVDKEGGIDIDDCSTISSKLAKLLDDRDVIKEQYYLEVSSPGIDRPLKKDRDFLANYGKKVDVQLFAPIDGKKEIVGELKSHSETQVTLTLAKEKSLTIERKNIAVIRPHIEF